MTEELKQKAENFIIDRYKLNECYREDNAETHEYMRMDVHSQYEEEYQLYLAGAIENSVQWHDLRKDPNDLPVMETELLCQKYSGRCFVGYYNHADKKFYPFEKGNSYDVVDIVRWTDIGIYWNIPTV